MWRESLTRAPHDSGWSRRVTDALVPRQRGRIWALLIRTRHSENCLSTNQPPRADSYFVQENRS